MSIAVAVWTLTAKPGKTELVRFAKDVRISLVTLGETIVDQERSSVKLHVSDEDEDETEKQTFVLANFVPGKIEAQTVDLIIGETEVVEVEVTGKNTVHLSGNYIDQPRIGDEDSDSEDDEPAYRLEDVSSDVEMYADDFGDDDDENEDDGEEMDSNRFEEIAEDLKAAPEPAKPAKSESAKRPRDSTATDSGKPEGNAPKKHKRKNGEAGAPKSDKPQPSKAPISPGKPAAKPESKPANKPVSQPQQPQKPVSANGAPGQGGQGQNKKDKKKNKNKNKEQKP